MSRRALLCALWLLLAAAPSQACREADAPIGFEADTALLLGEALGQYAEVPPGEVLYYERSRFYPEENHVPVRGYVVRVQAYHQPEASGLKVVFEGSGSKAILVPWGYRGDCKTTRWDEASGRWIASTEPAVYAAKLRSVAAEDGTPIFDVYGAYFEPYPTAKLVRDRIAQAIRGGQRFLTAQEYFIFGASLPVRDAKTGALSGGRIGSWVSENPDLATRWPASESLEALRARGAL
jgi:hypothetical protein